MLKSYNYGQAGSLLEELRRLRTVERAATTHRSHGHLEEGAISVYPMWSRDHGSCVTFKAGTAEDDEVLAAVRAAVGRRIEKVKSDLAALGVEVAYPPDEEQEAA